MSVVVALSSAFAAENKVEGTGNNVNICQPKIEVKSCGSCCQAKPRVIVKTVEKIVEKPVVVEKIVEVDRPHILPVREVIVEKKIDRTRKNHVSLLAGYGALGNLKETQETNKTVVRTENGPVLGLQYLREVRSGEKSSLDLLIQAQTNRTISVGIGIGF
jgi:hypothetical protein